MAQGRHVSTVQIQYLKGSLCSLKLEVQTGMIKSVEEESVKIVNGLCVEAGSQYQAFTRIIQMN